MKKDHVLEQGFTLIEIIIVLVLLGILAATAVPKYFDLQKVAQARAAQSAIAELQAQVNLTFANELMKGTTCTATGEGNQGALELAQARTQVATAIEGWTVTVTKASGEITKVTKKGATDASASEEFSFTAQQLKDLLTGYAPKISYPSCTN